MRTLLAAVVSIMALTPAAWAQSESTGAYFGLSGGLSLVPDSDVSATVNGIPASGEVEFDPGFSIGAQAGYKWQQSIRTEVEYRFSRAETDSATVSAAGLTATGPVSGSAWSHAILANAWYDWDLKNGWMPYAGGGVGGFIIDATDSDADFVFGGQVGAGISYAYTKDVVFDLGYRYVITQDAELGTDVAGVSDIETEYSSHNFMIGVRGHF